VLRSRSASRVVRRFTLAAATLFTVMLLLDRPHTASASFAPKLHIEEVGSDSTAFDVVATIVTGPTEALLWDTQYHLNDARRLADRIAASGKRLKAIVISHPDHDHFAGAAAIVERFPGTPVYMTAKALEEYKRTAPPAFRNEKSRAPQMLPDSIVTPQALPSMQLKVDGELVEVIPDLTGDVITDVNSVLWIPSISAVLASDVVFNGVHAWLGNSDVASRTRWRESIKRIAALHPKVVVAGHKKDVASPDTPDVLDAMDRYLADFDALRKTSANPPALFEAMKQKYPDHAVAGLLRYGAQVAFGGGPPGVFDDETIRSQLTAVNKAWSAVRLGYDSATAERMLTPDFFVMLQGQRVSRQEFISMVSRRPPAGRLARFDNTILSITKDANKEEYVAVVVEKLENERPRADGSGIDRLYALWVTRDGFRRVGSGWQIMYSEAIGFQSWGGGQKPPFADW
jgi:glyoxylase-like metal-dependent hydrolase (beta-lactamase superfamily II)